ncbi:ferric reductase transmembrane component 3 [Dichotomopilus funicola]|uniref:Ferric reductase transmembrane component 3 n=1 Tax=Dichotomopilus funicola TaxID=1934379 RepID=A0AAN6ZJE3_9PEZI|nr:ferric reductase transmembrane component 3 [Dichotomopilus funicola]
MTLPNLPPRAAPSPLIPRHIQNLSSASNLEPHWGYASRAVPCTNDPGSCAYLDAVYDAHDRGMVYTGIFWLTLVGLVGGWGVLRILLRPRGGSVVDGDQGEKQQGEEEQQQPNSILSTTTRLVQTLHTTTTHHLLPSSPVFLSPLLGHPTRLQLLLLTILTSYLTLFTFLGITYSTWITPIKNQPPTVLNTRTSIGPWADRVGVLAYALTPLSILLSSRESVLSLVTGVPYTGFLFLHRWTGYVILVQSVLHTVGWVVVEAKLYNPQPEVWEMYINQGYAIWGVVGLVVLVMMWVLSWRVVVRRVTGYEVFRKAHYVLGMVYIGALVGHWAGLQCFLLPGVILWGLDRAVRLVRTGLLHCGWWSEEGSKRRWGFRAAEGTCSRVWEDAEFGDVVRIDLEHPQKPWAVGQHYYLCFPESSIWQSHPFTPVSLPVLTTDAAGGKVKHTYIFRAKGGETKKIAGLLARKLTAAPTRTATTPIILQGPYGQGTLTGLTLNTNILCIAGGTGITYVLPVLTRLVRGPVVADRKVELIWAVKRKQDLQWVEPELDELRRLGAAHGLRVRIFVTAKVLPLPAAEAESESKETKVTAGDEARAESEDDIESSPEAPPAYDSFENRPDVGAVVDEFVACVVQGPTRVFGSGPPGMVVDLRAGVARCNSGRKVWKGEERFNVSLECDDRMEW